MAVTLPAAINLHTNPATSDTNYRGAIGASTSTNGTKSAGNLPITDRAAQYSNSSGLSGISFNLPTSFDSSTNTRILIWAVQFNAPNRIQCDTLSNNGQVVRIYSGVGANYRQFRVGGNNTPGGNSQSGALPLVFDPQAPGYSSEVGTWDDTNITGYAFANTYLSISSTSSTLAFFTRIFSFETVKDGDLPTFTGNSNFDDIITAVLGIDYTSKIHTFVSKAGSTYTLLCPFQIGDNGVTTTNFNDNGATVLSPTNNDISDPRFQLSNQAMRVYLSLGVSDSVTLSGTYVWGTPATWNFDQSTGTVNINGSTFNNMGNFVCGSSVSGAASFNLNASSYVIINGADLDGSTINGNTNLQGSSVTTLTNINISGGLDFDTAGTYTLDGCTISEVTNSSGGNITLTLLNGATIVTNTGPNITLNQPVDITAPNIIDGSRVQIYNVTKSSELDNSVVSGGSGYSYEVNLLSSAVDIGDTIRLRATYQSGTTAKKPLLSNNVITVSGLSFIDSQENLTAYGTLGVDGSTVSEYNIDSNTGHLQIDANDSDCLSTKKRIVARYYYLITSADGIDRFFNAIVLEDEANAVIDRSVTTLMLDNIGNCTLNLTDNEFRLYTSDNSSWIQDPPTGGYGVISDSGKVYAVNQDQIETIVNAIKAKTDLFTFTGNDVKATLDGEQVVASNMRGTDGANTTTPPTVTEIRAGFNENDFKADVTNLDATISSRSTFDPTSDTVARVTLVDTTTTNTDMRGTDGANTVAPDNAGIAQIQTDISNLNDVTAAEVYAEFTSGNNEDAFKADVSSLATEANATANTNSIITEVNANETKLDTIDTNVDSILEDTSTTIPNQISGLNDISTAEAKAQADQALIDYDPPTKAELDTVETNITNAIPTVGSVADAVWDEPYNQHTTAGSFGKLMDLLRKANRAIDGEVTGTPTVSSFSTNLTSYTNGAFDSELMVFVSGSINGEARPILSYSGGTFTFEEQWTQAPSSGDEFVILPYHTHPISEIQQGLAKTNELNVVNEGVKKASKIIPHNTDI